MWPLVTKENGEPAGREAGREDYKREISCCKIKEKNAKEAVAGGIAPGRVQPDLSGGKTDKGIHKNLKSKTKVLLVRAATG